MSQFQVGNIEGHKYNSFVTRKQSGANRSEYCIKKTLAGVCHFEFLLFAQLVREYLIPAWMIQNGLCR